MSNDNISDTALQTAGQCWCDEETAGIEMDHRLALAFARRYTEMEQRLLAAEAEKQQAIDAALEDTATTERIAQQAALLQKDEHPEDAIYWQGRSDGHGVSLINIRSRIGSNPLAEAQETIEKLRAHLRREALATEQLARRVRELERELEEAKKALYHMAAVDVIADDRPNRVEAITQCVQASLQAVAMKEQGE